MTFLPPVRECGVGPWKSLAQWKGEAITCGAPGSLAVSFRTIQECGRLIFPLHVYYAEDGIELSADGKQKGDIMDQETDAFLTT